MNKKLLYFSILLTVILVLSGGCSRESVNIPDNNVILITVDTLRADHVGIYGNEEIKTPNIDRFGREGVVFKRAYSQTHFTTPSHISIFSSLYLKEHGSYTMGKQTMDSDLKTLPEIMARENYRTSAFISLAAMRPSWVQGISRGFDLYVHPDKGTWKSEKTYDQFKWWINSDPQNGFFTWLHFFDPHMPYKPPDKYDKMYYRGDPKTGENTMNGVVFSDFWSEDKFSNWLNPIKDIQFPKKQYMAEITYVDSVIGKVRTLLKKHNLLENTLIILTSDHGENLGEHDIYFDHQGLFETSLKIPLVFWKKGIEPKRLTAPVMSIDILPTILDITDINRKGLELSGKSLVPLIKGNNENIHNFIFSESWKGISASVSTKKWRYIKYYKDYNYHKLYSPEKGDENLYSNSDQEHNVISRYPDKAKKLENILELWKRSETGKFEAKKEKMSKEEKKLLGSLGYL